MSPPARLTTPEARSLLALMEQRIRDRQAAVLAEVGKFAQVRAEAPADRAPFDPDGMADAFAWRVDEYVGPLGSGWEAHVEVPMTADEADDGVARVWGYSIHAGPERHRDRPAGWYVVRELASGGPIR